MKLFFQNWEVRVLTLLVFLSMSANLLCNSSPLVLKIDSQWYFPGFGGHSPETSQAYFYPDLKTYLQSPEVKPRVDFILWAPVHYGPNETDNQLLSPPPTPPSVKHPLGTDDRGRDVLARLLFGLRYSIAFGLIVSLCSSALGLITGLASGYFGGWIDTSMIHLTEVLLAIPALHVIYLSISFFGPSLALLALIKIFFSWYGVAHFVRLKTLELRTAPWVEALKLLNFSKPRILFHLFPKVLAPLSVLVPYQFAAAVTILATLDYLGLGLPPPTPCLGELIHQGRDNPDAYWLVLAPMVCLWILLFTLFRLPELTGKKTALALTSEGLENKPLTQALSSCT